MGSFGVRFHGNLWMGFIADKDGQTYKLGLFSEKCPKKHQICMIRKKIECF